MDPNLLFQVEHFIPFGLMIVFYFFIAGMSSGLFLLATLGPVFGIEKMNPLSKPASVMALAALIPGILALIIDLGKPLRFLSLMYRFNPSSAMSWGTYILTIYGISCVIFIFFLWKGNMKQIKLWGIVGIVGAISLGLYTGFLIALAPGKPLWNSALVPILFLLSGLIAGLSMISLCKSFFSKITKLSGEGIEEAMHSVKIWFILLEFLLLGAHLLALLVTNAGQTVVTHLLTGEKMISFVVVQVGVGMVLPLILLIISRSYKVLGITGIFSLIGVLALRYNIVIAGQELPQTGTLLKTLENSTQGWIEMGVFLVLSFILLLFLPSVADKIFSKLNKA